MKRDWWLKMAREANYRWNNYAWCMYYIEIEEFCISRANEYDY